MNSFRCDVLAHSGGSGTLHIGIHQRSVVFNVVVGTRGRVQMRTPPTALRQLMQVARTSTAGSAPCAVVAVGAWQGGRWPGASAAARAIEVLLLVRIEGQFARRRIVAVVPKRTRHVLLRASHGRAQALRGAHSSVHDGAPGPRAYRCAAAVRAGPARFAAAHAAVAPESLRRTGEALGAAAAGGRSRRRRRHVGSACGDGGGGRCCSVHSCRCFRRAARLRRWWVTAAAANDRRAAHRWAVGAAAAHGWGVARRRWRRTRRPRPARWRAGLPEAGKRIWPAT